MLEIVVTCILLYAGEKIEVEPPWTVAAIEALAESRPGYGFAFIPGTPPSPLNRVSVTMKRPVNEGEAVALPKACRSDVEVRK